MFYTKFAKIISGIILFLGLARVAMGILVASTDNPKLAAAQYLGNHTSGEAIDKGLLYVLIAVSLGVLVEISMNIHNRSQDQPEPNKNNI